MNGVFSSFMADAGAQPDWVVTWMSFMVAVLALSVPFALVRREALAVALVMAVTIPVVLWMYTIFGYSRILGLSHVILWTPLVVWLLSRRQHWFAGAPLSGTWVALCTLVLIISLGFDYTDTIRWLLGERG
ncbi:hypothetical protein [Henriciella sp.]|uniref:hypothetical protein n=1 Tax=Henriciella sp. TaxID=1968823 RepID=UPI00260E3031|nr:hypothetical protein [Henriciella sp.]